MQRIAIALTLIAVGLAGSVVTAIANSRQNATAAPTTYSDSGPEPQLSRILDEIENNRHHRTDDQQNQADGNPTADEPGSTTTHDDGTEIDLGLEAPVTSKCNPGSPALTPAG